MVKKLTRVPGHVQPVGRPCGTWMHNSMRDVKDIGQQMGYHSLEWNWQKEVHSHYFPLLLSHFRPGFIPERLNDVDDPIVNQLTGKHGPQCLQVVLVQFA